MSHVVSWPKKLQVLWVNSLNQIASTESNRGTCRGNLLPRSRSSNEGSHLSRTIYATFHMPGQTTMTHAHFTGRWIRTQEFPHSALPKARVWGGWWALDPSILQFHPARMGGRRVESQNVGVFDESPVCLNKNTPCVLRYVEVLDYCEQIKCGHFGSPFLALPSPNSFAKGQRQWTTKYQRCIARKRSWKRGICVKDSGISMKQQWKQLFFPTAEWWVGLQYKVLGRFRGKQVPFNL